MFPILFIPLPTLVRRQTTRGRKRCAVSIADNYRFLFGISVTLKERSGFFGHIVPKALQAFAHTTDEVILRDDRASECKGCG